MRIVLTHEEWNRLVVGLASGVQRTRFVNGAEEIVFNDGTKVVVDRNQAHYQKRRGITETR